MLLFALTFEEISFYSMELIKMTEEQYSAYRTEFLDSLRIAFEKNCKVSSTDAILMAEQTLNDVLPEGLCTKDHDLFVAMQSEEIVGYVWVVWNRKLFIPTAYIYDLRVVQQKRRKGLGRAIMSLVEQMASKLAMKQILLHVFHSNQNAFRFYTQQVGFEIQSSYLRKSLTDKQCT